MTALPLIQELSSTLTVPAALVAFQHWPGLVLFDSARPSGRLGRYSFLSADPSASITIDEPVFGDDPFAAIRQLLEPTRRESVPDLPPFQGGAAGLLSYECGQFFERLPVPRCDEFRIPAVTVGIYDWVLAWDHLQGRCWLIAQGFPESTPTLQRAHARDRLQSVQRSLSAPSPSVLAESTAYPLVTFQSPQFSLDGNPTVTSNFSRAGYLAAVRQVIEYIYAGDIFQANLSQRLLARATLSPLQQYLQLRSENPAPFGGYFAREDWAVLSSSPERFLQLRENEVITRPIKGTRRRRRTPEADLFTRDELRESEKDRAENVMIVDLMRNDLSRVCRAGSVRVPELCVIESYETVTHLVSEVRGQLQPEATFWDLLRATFPGGSITGAPKIRAMEIITELEQVARGAYCGSLFYHGFDGTADSSILIRTMTQRGGWLAFPAGGGIVAQSQPADEYLETLHKARGLLQAIR
ncbi:aminodeoxychorismate synthase component I [Planctomicrobium sp. SH664]|uniref:aminodeoxychorismate synthase component I n=1 Tax=Planctomicrobium sp. SH664 TaxID=3448125 RepID=UPI003F5BD678